MGQDTQKISIYQDFLPVQTNTKIYLSPIRFSAGYMALSAAVLWLGPVRRHYKQDVINPFTDKPPFLESPIRFLITLVGVMALCAVVGGVVSILMIRYDLIIDLPILDDLFGDDYHRLVIEQFRNGNGVLAGAATGTAVYMAKILR